MHTSLWKTENTLPGFDSLDGDAKTDVLIIGGGMAGLLCALLLKEAGVNYLLLEADAICSGTTGNTTAKITSQHGLTYHKLLRRFGEEGARLYYQANQAALEHWRALCRDIDCGFEEKDSLVYSLRGEECLQQELEALSRIGAEASFAETTSLPFPTDGAVRFPRQAQFDPLAFVSAAAGELNIREHSPVRAITGGFALTDGGKVRAEKFLVCTHFPFLNRHGSYFLKLYQSRSYAAAFGGGMDVNGMYLDESGKGLSLRNSGDALLVGGGSHRTGKKGEAWRGVEDFARRFLPGARELCRWAAQDCMSLDGMPYVGPYGAHTPGVYVATGFGKWGMTGSMAAAELLRDAVLERESPYGALFSPQRSLWHPQLFANAAGAVVNLLTPTAPRCPHLGCALKWNSSERSWDCPCHGSRFGENGALLDDPATGALKKAPKKKA